MTDHSPLVCGCIGGEGGGGGALWSGLPRQLGSGAPQHDTRADRSRLSPVKSGQLTPVLRDLVDIVDDVARWAPNVLRGIIATAIANSAVDGPGNSGDRRLQFGLGAGRPAILENLFF